MVNMKKAPAGTGANEKTYIDYNTEWDKKTLQEKVRLLRKFAHVMQSNLVGSEWMPCTEKEKAFRNGKGVGMLFVLDELAKYIDRMSENSEVRYGERDVI